MNTGLQQVSAYFDGGLAPDEQKSLGAWLLEDQRRIDEFVIRSFVHTQLLELLSRNQVQANALVGAEATIVPAAPSPSTRSRQRRWINRASILAASLVIIAILGYLVVARPTVVATVSRTQNVQWIGDAEPRKVGSLLRAGDVVALDRGTVFVTFARGGQIALEGPCRFHVDSDSSGELRSGKLSAFVPEHAVGFRVQCGPLAIVDLGTEFQVKLLDDQSSLIQVFDGLVELQFAAAGRNADRRLQITQGRAIHFDAKSRTIHSVDYDKEQQMPMSVWAK